MTDTFFRFASLMGCIFVAFLYLNLWLTPGDPHGLFISFKILFVEIALVHIGLIAMIFSRRIIIPVILVACIVSFFLIRNQLYQSPLVIAYAFIVLFRFRFDFYEKSLNELATQVIASFKFIFIGFFCLMFVNFFPLPSFGLSDEYLESSHYFDLYDTPYRRISGSHLSQEQRSVYQNPVELICLGVLYFTSMAFFEFRTIQLKRSGTESKFLPSVMGLLGGLFRNRK